MEKFGIGQGVLREEDPRLLRGNGLFVNDVDLPGQAHAVVLRSPHAHADILGIDTSAASDLPGVLATIPAETSPPIISACPGCRQNGCVPTCRP